MRGIRTGSLLAMAAVALTARAVADDFIQLGAHEHGHVTLNVVVQADLLRVELESPGQNVLGFEHAPRTDVERRQIAVQEAWLRAGRGAIGVPPSAACRLEGVDVSAPTWDNSKPGEDHGDYRVVWRFRCANSATLAWFEPWLLQKLLGVSDTEVNVINGNLQTRIAASDPRQRIALR